MTGERGQAGERRGKPRKAVRAVPLRSPAPGGVIEIGPSGMLIEIYTSLEPGRRATFSIGEAKRSARLRGVVRWCRLVGVERDLEGEQRAVYRAGIAFSE